MVVIACPVQGCSFKTDDVEMAAVTVLLQLHALNHQSTTAGSRAPKLDRSSIEAGVHPEGWNSFVRKWEAYRIGSGISDDMASTQLFQCAGEGLADVLLKSVPDVNSRPVTEVLDAMRALAVIPVARGVLRADLMKMQQSNGESFRFFAARVRGKAETCSFSAASRCLCAREVVVDYTTEVVRDVLLAGIGRSDIRREALSAEDLQKQGINDIVGFVESREMAYDAVNSRQEPPSLSALSSFKRRGAEVGNSQSTADKPQSAQCPDCGKPFNFFRRGKNGWNRRPFRNCQECWRASRVKPRSAGDNESKSVTILCASSSTKHLIKVRGGLRDFGIIR